MTQDSIEARDIASQVHSYANLSVLEETGPLVISRGDRAYVIDNHEKRYLDGMAGLWSAPLSFSEQRLGAVSAWQYVKLPFLS